MEYCLLLFSTLSQHAFSAPAKLYFFHFLRSFMGYNTNNVHYMHEYFQKYISPILKVIFQVTSYLVASRTCSGRNCTLQNIKKEYKSDKKGTVAT